jgi:putative ABC transport system substrate-binding protein
LNSVAVLWNPDAPVQAKILETIKSIGTSLGIDAKGTPISHQGDIQKASEAIGEDHPQAVMVLVDSFSLANRLLIAKLAAERRLITSFEVKDYVLAGGLVSYGLPYLDHYARGADFVAKIVNGADPRDLPIEQPTRYELVINQRPQSKSAWIFRQPFLLALMK